MGFCHLPVFFPFDSVMMKEKGAVVLLDLLRPRRFGIFQLVLNELQMHAGTMLSAFALGAVCICDL